MRAERRGTVLVGARFHVDRFELLGRDGEARTRELVVHPGAVVILPLLDDGRVVLIRNHRPMLGATLLELPAGTLEPGEPIEGAARRELREETGYEGASFESLPWFYASPGITDEKMHPFVARGLVAGEQHLDATEEIEVCTATKREARELVASGAIADGKTLALLFHWLLDDVDLP